MIKFSLNVNTQEKQSFVLVSVIWLLLDGLQLIKFQAMQVVIGCVPSMTTKHVDKSL